MDGFGRVLVPHTVRGCYLERTTPIKSLCAWYVFTVGALIMRHLTNIFGLYNATLEIGDAKL